MDHMPIHRFRWIMLLFSHSVVSNSSRPQALQHTRLPCPSPSPGVHSNPCPLSQWCHPTISSSVIPFSSCPQSFLASQSLLMSRLSSHQMTKVLEFQLQHHSFQWVFKTDLINWFDLAIQGTLKSLLQHHSSKASIIWHSAFFIVQLYIHTWLLEKNQ